MVEDRNRALRNVSGPPPHRKRAAFTLAELLIVLGIIAIIIFLIFPATRGGGRGAREVARRNSCLNNLKQIAIALKDYEASHGALPPAYTSKANGKPLHSWRTLILPYMEEQQLYDSIDLTKPWDDSANAEALNHIPSAYQCPSNSDDDNRTTYLAVVTPNSCLRAAEPSALSALGIGVS